MYFKLVSIFERILIDKQKVYLQKPVDDLFPAHEFLIRS